MSDKIRVLFLCTGNSARSQMAEAFLRRYGGDRFEAYSAGLEPKGINPYTRRFWTRSASTWPGTASKELSIYLGKLHFGYLITVCSNAEERCPVFPGMGVRSALALRGSGSIRRQR